MALYSATAVATWLRLQNTWLSAASVTGNFGLKGNNCRWGIGWSTCISLALVLPDDVPWCWGGDGKAVLVSSGMDTLLLQWRATTLACHTAAKRPGPVDSRTTLPTSTPVPGCSGSRPFQCPAPRGQGDQQVQLLQPWRLSLCARICGLDRVKRLLSCQCFAAACLSACTNKAGGLLYKCHRGVVMLLVV